MLKIVKTKEANVMFAEKILSHIISDKTKLILIMLKENRKLLKHRPICK